MQARHTAEFEALIRAQLFLNRDSAAVGPVNQSRARAEFDVLVDEIRTSHTAQRAAVEAYRQGIIDQRNACGVRASATSRIVGALRQSRLVMPVLHALVARQLRGDRVLLAVWQMARQIRRPSERAPRRRTGAGHPGRARGGYARGGPGQFPRPSYRRSCLGGELGGRAKASGSNRPEGGCIG